MGNNSSMDWEKLLSPKRYGASSTNEDSRSEFQRDVDRILFCGPFRRLARKTQVHPLNENDNIHSRLTHSLETSSVGRSLGYEVGKYLVETGKGLPDWTQPHHLGQIVQAACLAHDIGNPPFGHSGEDAIKNWFKENSGVLQGVDDSYSSDFTKFDGNAMSVRILLSTGFYTEGMSPTLPVLGALLKYPWTSEYEVGKDKFSLFQTEQDAMAQLESELGMLRIDDRLARHPLAYLTEAADDICYRIIDIEDATEVDILPEGFMLDAFADVLKMGKEDIERYRAMHFRQRNSRLRTRLIGFAVKEVVETFGQHYDAIMKGTFDYKSSLLEESSHPVSQSLLSVYDSISDTLFLSRRKATLELGAQNALAYILNVFVKEALLVCSDESSSRKEQVKILLGKELVEKLKDAPADQCPYHAIMLTLDYVTGMSDHYATEMCRKLLGLGF